MDNPQGVTLVKQLYKKYEYDEDGYLLTDDNNEYVVKSESTTSKWTVQKADSDKHIAPYTGTSCLVTGLGRDPVLANDAQACELYFTVFGPGTFSFYCKSSCDGYGEDGLYVYLDGEEVSDFMTITGYGDDQDWEYYSFEITEPVKNDEDEVVSYEHEIKFVFFKDGPYYEYNDYDKLVYAQNDGPVKPVKSDYYGDTEWYNEDLAEYNTEMEYFWNCVWIDGVTWTPEPVILVYDDAFQTEYENNAQLFLRHNTDLYGYHIRYTVDGTEPNSTSPLYDDENGINVDTTCIVKAAVFSTSVDGTISAYSPETSISVNINIKASTPVIHVDETNTTMEKPVIKITDSYGTNIIRYTLDGTEPNESSPVYTVGLEPTDSVTIKAICTRPGVTSSESSEYQVKKAVSPTYIARNIYDEEEPNLVFSNGTSLTVTCTGAPSSTIKYSSTSETPDIIYTGPFTLSDAQKVVIQAFEFGCVPSDKKTLTAYKAETVWEIGSNGFALNNGWNLISIPMALTKLSIDKMLLAWTIFAYDSESCSYVKASTIEEGKAYWIFQDENTMVSLDGHPTGRIFPGTSGWNMIGVNQNASVPSEISAWKFENGQYKPAESFEKGFGYFIYKD